MEFLRSKLSSGVLAVFLLAASVGSAHGSQPPSGAGSRALECSRNSQCPRNPVFLDCQQGVRSVTWVLGSGQQIPFAFEDWREMVNVQARRTVSGTLELRLGWQTVQGKLASESKTLRLGESIALWTKGGTTPDHYGGPSGPLACTWAE